MGQNCPLPEGSRPLNRKIQDLGYPACDAGQQGRRSRLQGSPRAQKESRTGHR